MYGVYEDMMGGGGRGGEEGTSGCGMLVEEAESRCQVLGK
jgi:hypothetical protein